MLHILPTGMLWIMRLYGYRHATAAIKRARTKRRSSKQRDSCVCAHAEECERHVPDRGPRPVEHVRAPTARHRAESVDGTRA